MSRIARFAAASMAAATLLATMATSTLAAPVASPDASIEQQLADDVNGDRAQRGLSTLAVDPRLTDIARQRAQYMLDHGFFSHCIDGAPSCDFNQLHFAVLLSQDGFPGLAAGENIARNNTPEESAAGTTNAQWLNSPGHYAQIANPIYNATGVGVVCCTTVRGIPGVRIATQIFVQYTPQMLAALGTGNAPASVAPAAASNGSCQMVLGFRALHDLDPSDVGTCTDDEAHNPANGDALQHTTTGLMAWRKADNWTAFTNGYRTWINGPNGLAVRLNTQRFSWEANPDGLPLAGY